MKFHAALIAAIGAAAVAIAPGSAAAACPNEALRTGPASALPACRAYEMVSPVDKNGGNVSQIIGMHAAPSGEGALFISTSAFAGAAANPLINPYVARRGENWTTESVVAPQYNREAILIAPSPASSPELEWTLQASLRALTPGAIEEGSNVYLRNNLTGERRLIVAKPGNELFRAATNINGVLWAQGTSDWSHILLRSEVPLTANAAKGVLNNYDYDVATGELSLVNTVKPKVGLIEGDLPPYPNRMSTDGSRVYFGLAGGGVYLRENGAAPVAISVSRRKADKGKVLPARFSVASADGSVAYFVSPEELLEGGETAGSESLYRYDRSTNALTLVTPASLNAGEGASVGQVMAASEDGSYVYFTAGGALAPKSKPAGANNINFYVAHEGTIRLVARTTNGENEFGPPPNFIASPNGKYFAFSSYSPLLPKVDPASPENCSASPIANNLKGSCLDAYLYAAETETLSCLTCTGEPALGDSSVGGQRFHEGGLGQEYPHSALDDGTVFVETPNQLLASDQNEVGDVYASRAGADELISTGRSVAPSQFGDATADGGNVFFFTTEQLVPQDVDGSVDVYDDREGGGLATQFPPTPPAACEGEGCRGALTSEPPGLPPASSVDVCAGLLASASKDGREAKAALGRAKAAARAARHAGSKAGAKHRRAKRLRREAAALRRSARAAEIRADACRRDGQ